MLLWIDLGVRTPTICDQPSPKALPKEFFGNLDATRQPHHKDRDPGGGSRPQPRPLLPFPPPGFVHVRRGQGLYVGPSFGHRGGDRLDGGLLQIRNGPQAHREAKQLLQDALGRAFGQKIRACAQGDDGLRPRTKFPGGDPRRHFHTGRFATHRADQKMLLIFGDQLSHWRDLGHLVALGLEILTAHRVLAMLASLRLDGNHHVHLFDRHPCSCLSLVTRLSAWPAPTGPTAWPFPSRLRGIARGRPRGGARVLLQPLGQVLDSGLQTLDYGLQHGDSRFEGLTILLDFDGQALPHLLWQRKLGVHGSRMVQEIESDEQAFHASPTCTVTAALTVLPKRQGLGLYLCFQPRNLQATKVTDFLCALLRHLRSHNILLWDRGSIHRGPAIEAVSKAHPRLPLAGY